MRGIATIAVAIGASMVVLGWFWPQMADGRSAWSEKDAKEFMAARAEEHRLRYEAAMANEQAKDSAPGSNPQKSLAESRLSAAAAGNTTVDPTTASPDRVNAEFAAAKQRYEQQRAVLDQARSHGEDTAAIIRWVGFALVGAGLVALIAVRPQGGR